MSGSGCTLFCFSFTEQMVFLLILHFRIGHPVLEVASLDLQECQCQDGWRLRRCEDASSHGDGQWWGPCDREETVRQTVCELTVDAAGIYINFLSTCPRSAMHHPYGTSLQLTMTLTASAPHFMNEKSKT